MLTDVELHLLVEFKLNGGNAAELGAFNGTSANAVRQKLKRTTLRPELSDCMPPVVGCQVRQELWVGFRLLQRPFQDRENHPLNHPFQVFGRPEQKVLFARVKRLAVSNPIPNVFQGWAGFAVEKRPEIIGVDCVDFLELIEQLFEGRLSLDTTSAVTHVQEETLQCREIRQESVGRDGPF